MSTITLSVILILVALIIILCLMGYPARARRIYAEEENRPFLEAINLAKGGRIYSVEELIEFGDKAPEIILSMAQRDHFLAVEDLIKLLNIRDSVTSYIIGWKILQKMASRGCDLPIDQIVQFGYSPSIDNEEYFPLSIWMVKYGHTYTLDEIFLLGNPKDRWSATLAHWQACYGYKFNLDELIRLGECRIHFNENDFAYADYAGETVWTISDFTEAQRYDKKFRILHNGATVAHIMAREGYKFTDEEIEKLGDPKDAEGLSLKDWMKRAASKAEPQKV